MTHLYQNGTLFIENKCSEYWHHFCYCKRLQKEVSTDYQKKEKITIHLQGGEN